MNKNTLTYDGDTHILACCSRNVVAGQNHNRIPAYVAIHNLSANVHDYNFTKC